MDRPIEVSWCKADRGWGVGCEPNELFRKHAEKIWRYKPLIERIVQRCQMIFEKLSWNVSWIEVQFTRSGPGILVEGVNGCYCAPDGHGGYIEHNIDTADQALCIYLCLRTAIDEVENALIFWEEQKQQGKEIKLDPEPERALAFRFDKDTTPWSLFSAQVLHFDEPQLDFCRYIWAKGSLRAKQIAEEKTNLFRSTVLIDEVTAGPDLNLSEVLS